MLDKIGRYELRRLLGEGAEGAVFEGYDPLLQRRVAIKAARRSVFGRTEAAVLSARFQREAQVAGLLHHPKIVPVYDAGADGEVVYLVLQFAPGDDLNALWQRGERPDAGQATSFVIDLLQALEYAHAHGVVHLDVRPPNLLVADSECRLTDFGAARIEGDALPVGGRPPNRYSAPELICSEPLDHRADLFSAGVVLYELLTGAHPFEAPNTFLALQRITSQEAAPPSRLQPALPPALDAIARRALARRPEHRYQSARDMREDLEATLVLRSDRGEPPVAAGDTRTTGAAVPASALPTAAISSRGDRPAGPPVPRAVAVFAELPAQTPVEEFRILRTLASGGFGIVYLAEDTSLGRQVALKEFFPRGFAQRLEDGRVEAVPPNQALFASTLESFYREAQVLAGLEHPAVARVYRTFRGNGTAYIAMPYYEGETVKAYVQRGSPGVDDAWLRKLLLQVGDALSVLHTRHTCHRDVAPDNIMLTSAGPVLLDFGAARQVLAESDRTLTVILKQGFAPPEQYGGSARQGSWTDVYALAAVGFYCVTGQPPQSSVDRLLQEQLEVGRWAASKRFSRPLLATIEAGLRLDPAQRPRSMADFLQALRS